MGAQEFSTYQDGAVLETTFYAAREEAAYLNGHGGYTGSLAEKDAVTVIEAEPTSREAAITLAVELMEVDDELISDKWGPAGAIRVKDDKHDGWLFFGWASS